MPPRTDKNTLKQYFRSGSRPTQKQFHELIDNCYNGDLGSAVSGYQVLVDSESTKTVSSIRRESGKTFLVPFFERINIVNHRVYHYAIPVCNVGSGYTLERITMEISLPQTSNYTVKDRSKELNIRQTVTVQEIKVHNGGEEIYVRSSGIKFEKSIFEVQIEQQASQWFGIGIDIAVAYDIKSDIAVSDQFNIAEQSKEMLLHTFGSVACFFIAGQ
jgi:hypothetical protein